MRLIRIVSSALKEFSGSCRECFEERRGSYLERWAKCSLGKPLPLDEEVSPCFGKAQGNKPQNKIDSLIGAGTRVEGNIVFTGGLRVDGEIRGNVCGKG